MEPIQNLVSKARSEALDSATRQKAFERIVKQFQDMALGCALGVLGDFHLAQDVAQDAFLTAYTDLGKLENPEAFPGWFKQILLRKAYRVKRFQVERVAPLDNEFPSTQIDQSEVLEKAEEETIVHRAIQSLSEHERTVIALHYLTGYSQQKIAEYLEISNTAVRKRLQLCGLSSDKNSERRD